MTTNDHLYPDFIIVGGMKCATSTLHDQLAAQPGIFMTTPKEPNYFSNDEIFANGHDWYSSLFKNAAIGDLKGESSTHYTKFPTYPQTISRMLSHSLGAAKFIYVIRDPIDRLISQYIHEWSEGTISCDINEAIEKHSQLIDYSLYAYQLEHYLQSFSPEQMLVVFFEKLTKSPQEELERVCRFLEYKQFPKWDFEMAQKNVSSQRIRKFPLYNLLIKSSLMEALRRTLIPRQLRERVKQKLTMQHRPKLTLASREKLTQVFNHDLEALGQILGLNLNYSNYKSVAMSNLETEHSTSSQTVITQQA